MWINCRLWMRISVFVLLHWSHSTFRARVCECVLACMCVYVRFGRNVLSLQASRVLLRSISMYWHQLASLRNCHVCHSPENGICVLLLLLLALLVWLLISTIFPVPPHIVIGPCACHPTSHRRNAGRKRPIVIKCFGILLQRQPTARVISSDSNCLLRTLFSYSWKYVRMLCCVRITSI